MSAAVKFQGLTAAAAWMGNAARPRWRAISRQALAFVMGILALASSGAAQIRPGFTPGFGHFKVRRVPISRAARRRFFPAYPFYGAPFFYSDYEPYNEEYEPLEPPPQPPEPAAPAKIEPVPDPLLLELHGNQWVRVRSFTQPSGDGAPELANAPVARAKPLPPAILVFRDGHTEELTSYSIIGQKIYTKAADWTTGAWTRSIQIEDLDVPATLKENEHRGVNFELPSGPDEVMIRP